MSNPFSFRRFCRTVSVPRSEQSLVRDLMAQGLEDYYHQLYGYHKYGRRPDFLIDERMGEPFIFGYGAVRVLHHDGISAATKERLARYTLDVARPGQEYGMPYGLLLPIGVLAAAGKLRGKKLVEALKTLTCERDVFTGLKTSDVPPLAEALIGGAGLSPEDVVSWLRFLLVRAERTFEPAKALMEAAMTHPRLSDATKQTLCHQLIEERSGPRLPALTFPLQQLEEIVQGEGLTPAELERRMASSFGLEQMMQAIQAHPLTPHFLMRQAIAWLPEVGEAPRDVVERYLGGGGRYTREPINQGVADVIAAHHADMPAAFVRDALERGAAHPEAAVRKRFYAVGLELLGPDFVRPALDDRSGKIRRWAQKQLKKG